MTGKVLKKMQNSIVLSLWGLQRYPLRTHLAMLMIGIGIATYVLMLAVGAGAYKKIDSMLDSIGHNQLVINAGELKTFPDRNTSIAMVTTLRMGDVEILENSLQQARHVVPYVELPLAAERLRRRLQGTVIGTTNAYLKIRKFDLQRGRYFDRWDEIDGKPVVIIGSYVARSLFGDENPINKTILFGVTPFYVIGELQEKGLSVEGANNDNIILMPVFTALNRIRNDDYLDKIYVQTEHEWQLKSAASDIQYYLRESHQLDNGISNGVAKEDDFNVVDQTHLAKVRAGNRHLSGVMIKSISMAVILLSGIGLLIIMLMAVKQRYSEIGLRKAIGAKDSAIVGQFFLESIMLGIGGGIEGVVIGCGAVWLVEQATQWSLLLEPASLLFSFLLSFSVGILSGVFPALKTAKLDPVIALSTK